MAEQKSCDSLLWFLGGLGVGAVIGLLYAPKSGREIRQEITEQAEEGRDYVVGRAQQIMDQARQARDQAQQWAEKSRSLYEQQKEQLKSIFQVGKAASAEAATGSSPESAKGDL
jgi:gas vesicle protein